MAYHYPDPPPDEAMPVRVGDEYVPARYGGGSFYYILIAHNPVTGQGQLAFRGLGTPRWVSEGTLRSLYRHRFGGYHG
jgi:hypothetical protein